MFQLSTNVNQQVLFFDSSEAWNFIIVQESQQQKKTFGYFSRLIFVLEVFQFVVVLNMQNLSAASQAQRSIM